MKKIMLIILLFCQYGNTKEIANIPIGEISDPQKIELDSIKLIASLEESRYEKDVYYVDMKLQVKYLTRACDHKLVLRGVYSSGIDLFGVAGDPPRFAIYSDKIGCTITSGINFQTAEISHNNLSLKLINDKKLNRVYFGSGDSYIVEIELSDSWTKLLQKTPVEIPILKYKKR